MNRLKEIIEKNNLKPWKWKVFLDCDEHFKKFVNNKKIRVLEIGAYKQESLKIWDKYFENIEDRIIVGVDNNTKIKECDIDKINIRIGSQSDPLFLKKIVDEYSCFDIIIDDGSHINKDQKITFNYLYNYLNMSGIYIVEDIYSSYHERWLRHEENKENTFMNYMKSKIDDLNHYWQTDNNWLPRGNLSEFEKNTSAIHFYDSFIVVEKRIETLKKHELI